MQLFQSKKEVEAEESLAQYLTFRLDEQDFGVELQRVQEIRGYTPITPIPNVPDYIKGVINLRGTVIPVMDLRMRFRKPVVDYTPFTVIVVAKVGLRAMGLIVDAVSDVLSIPPDALAPAPSFGNSVESRVVEGLIKTDDRLAVVLDLDLLVTLENLPEPITVQ